MMLKRRIREVGVKRLSLTNKLSKKCRQRMIDVIDMFTGMNRAIHGPITWKKPERDISLRQYILIASALYIKAPKKYKDQWQEMLDNGTLCKTGLVEL